MSSFEPLVRNITNHRERRKAINDGSSFQRLWLVPLTFGRIGRRVMVGNGSWLREQLLKHDGLLGQLLCPVSALLVINGCCIQSSVILRGETRPNATNRSSLTA